MNWLDMVIILIVLVVALAGMRTGLLSMAFTGIGVLIGWLLAGQLSDDLGELIGNSMSSDRWVTVVSYVIIIVLSVIVAKIVGRIVRPMLSVATLGLSAMVDRLGGLTVGLLVGLLVSGALIVAMARFAYNFDLPEGGVAGGMVKGVPRVYETKERVDSALTGSSLVPVFIDVADALPASTLGFVPSDFKASLDILEKNIDEKG